MKLKNFLYLTQLEEYDIPRIRSWLKTNPNKSVTEIKHHLVWTAKIKFLFLIGSILFFLPPQISVFGALYFLKPFDFIIKTILVFLATLKLRLFNRSTLVIVVTGSWGKTTTKNSLVQLFSPHFKVDFTPENHNTLLAIAKQSLFLPSSCQIFIVEAGAYQPGDIKKVCRLVKPQTGIITAVGPMHLERFGSLENILRAKMELAQSLPVGGFLLLPQTIEPQVQHFPIKVRNITYFTKTEQIYQSIAKLFNIKYVEPKAPSSHRQETIHNGSITIIDNTYNSNPVGFEMALKKLADSPSPNKILVTPGMIELGNLQFSENARLAKLAGKVCQHIIIVGFTNKEALLSGLKNTTAKIHPVANLTQAQDLLKTISTANSAILFENDLPDQYF